MKSEKKEKKKEDKNSTRKFSRKTNSTLSINDEQSARDYFTENIIEVTIIHYLIQLSFA